VDRIPRSITPAQIISVHENDPAQHTTVINARFAMALREKGRQTDHLLARQPYRSLIFRLFKEPELHPAAHINRF